MKFKFSLDGLIALIVGILIMIFPLRIFTGLALVVGVLMVIAGVRRFIGKIQRKSSRVINSILMIIIGLVLVGPVFPWFPVNSSDLLGYLIGAMFVYNGIYRVVKFKRVKTPMNESFANAGWVAIVVGLIIAFVPFISDAIIIIFTILIGLILVGYGVLRLFVQMNVVNKFQEFRHEYDKDENEEDIIDIE